MYAIILLEVWRRLKAIAVKYWVPLLLGTFLLVVYFYIQHIREELSQTRSELSDTKVQHSTYVIEQKKLSERAEKDLKDANIRLKQTTEELTRELSKNNEIIDRTRDTNLDLVSRLREQSKINTVRAESVPNTDPTILSKYKSLSKSFDECTWEVAELAAESDRLSTIITSIESSVGGFNKEVESLNQP
jgi:chromosome segregation ATPase